MAPCRPLPTLPAPQDWQHRTGAPGYFVTKDGRFQMLTTQQGGFVSGKTAQTKKDFEVVQGPSPNPEKLGIPARLLEEAEALTVQSLMDQLAAGQEITIQLTGDLGEEK